MIVTEKRGNLKDIEAGGRIIDRVPVQWFETGKRILHKQTGAGKNVVMKFLKEGQQLTQDDVIHEDNTCLVVIEIIPCDAIVMKPASLYEMAVVCYEIGNKHLPLFFENDMVMIPYEAPIHRMLQSSGLNPVVEKRKLLSPLRTSVAGHGHAQNRSTLFSKILNLTAVSDNA